MGGASGGAGGTPGAVGGAPGRAAGRAPGGAAGGAGARREPDGIMAARQLLRAAPGRRGYSGAGAAEFLHRSIVPTMHYQKSLPRYGGAAAPGGRGQGAAAAIPGVRCEERAEGTSAPGAAVRGSLGARCLQRSRFGFPGVSVSGFGFPAVSVSLLLKQPLGAQTP